MKKLLLIIAGFLLSLFLCCAVLSYFVNKQTPHKGIYPPTHGNTVSIFLIDGLSKSIFEKTLNAGKLPNISKLIDSGIYIKNGIGSFPSMTGYAFYPFITGMDAVESGIYGLRWFDRSLDKGNLRNYVGRTHIWMNQDINPKHKNIFELSGDQYTSSINSYMNKGVKHAEMTGWQHTTSKYGHLPFFRFLKAIPIWGNRLVSNFFEHETYTLQKAKKQLKRNPKVQWVTLPSLDAMNHIHGTTADYTKLLIHQDSLIGDFVKTIKKLNQDQTRGIVLITDHGVSDVHQNLDLQKVFKAKLGLTIERGTSTHIFTDQLDQALETFKNAHAYFVINGNLSAYLYFRNPFEKNFKQAWQKKLNYETLQSYPSTKGRINILDFLSQQEGVGIIACQQNDSTVFIQLQDKTALIKHRSATYKYEIIQGDPLNYVTNPMTKQLIDGNFHHKDQWLAHSISTNYPDALHRLYQLVHKKQSGDIVLCSKKGFDLAADYELFVGNYKGGHGGLQTDLVNVPYIISFPRHPQQNIPFARSEDVGVSIMDYLGFEVNYSLNGKTFLTK